MRKLDLTLLVAGLLLGGGWARPAVAGPRLDDQGDSGKAEEEKDGEKAEEEKDSWFAVTGADVYTGTGAVLRGATVLAKNGVIEELGYEVEVPEEAEVLDARGMRVYPGLIAVNSSGLFGTNSDFENSIDSFNQNMTLALSGGITTAAQSDVPIKLKRHEIDDLVAGEDHLNAISITRGNPSSISGFRQKLRAAAKYRVAYREWEKKKKEDKELKEPSKKGVDAGVLAILKGEKLAYFPNLNDRSEILEVARLAQDYSFRPVIGGCMEGWTVADELGRAGAFAIVTPRFRSDKNEARVIDSGSTIENAAILYRSGVQVCVIPGTASVFLTGIVGRDLMHIVTEAAFAVRGGLPEEAALASLTIVPARILGIAHRVGSLEVGKDCDLIVTDGDLLHYETFVQWAVIEGKVVYDKQAEIYFPHIRPRPETAGLSSEQEVKPDEALPAEEDDDEVLETSESEDGGGG